MNKESFIQVLRNPKSISEDQLAQVEEVVEQFPYFQIARSVIACGSRSLSKDDAQAKLAKAAIYTTNRQLLKKYVSGDLDFDVADGIQIAVHRETQDKTIPASSEDISTEPKKRAKFRIIERRSKSEDSVAGSGKFVDVTKKRKEENVDEELTIIGADGIERTTVTHSSSHSDKDQNQQEVTEVPEESVQAESSEVLEPDKTHRASPAKTETLSEEATTEMEEAASEENSSEVVTERTEVQEEKEEPKVDEPRLTAGELVDDVFKNLEQYKQSRDHYFEVEKDILSKQESDAIDSAIKKANTKITKKEEPKAKTKPVSVTSKASTKAKSSASPKPEIKKTESKKSTPAQPKATKKAASPKASTPAKEESSPVTKSTPVEMDPKKVDNDIISKESSDKKGKPSANKKEAQKEIIERFIKNNPKILPSDEEPKGEIDDLSTSSAEMKEDFATENLAVILSRQGKREKAIEIYEKLILKIPKKKSYFAARIAELK